MSRTDLQNNYAFYLGREIRKRRKTMGLSQMKLAELSNLSTVYIGRVERGQVTITIKNLIAVSSSLNTTIRSIINSVFDCDSSEREKLLSSIVMNMSSFDESTLIFFNRLIIFFKSNANNADKKL